MSKLPSNFTPEEVIKYANMDESVRRATEVIFDKILEQQAEITSLYKQLEIVEEQVGFRQDFIRQVMELCKSTTKHRELVKEITIALDNSYIEL